MPDTTTPRFALASGAPAGIRADVLVLFAEEAPRPNGAVAEIKERIAEQVDLPPGYSVEYGGQFESQRQATRLIVGLALGSLAAMFVVLAGMARAYDAHQLAHRNLPGWCQVTTDDGGPQVIGHPGPARFS